MLWGTPWYVCLWRCIWWVPGQFFRWMMLLCVLIGYGPFAAWVVKCHTE